MAKPPSLNKLWGKDWETLKADYGIGALSAALYLGRNYSDKTLRALGELAGGMQYPVVTMAIRPLSQAAETDVTLARKITRLRAILLVGSAEKAAPHPERGSPGGSPYP
jgi:hypothetical protein